MSQIDKNNNEQIDGKNRQTNKQMAGVRKPKNVF